MEADVAYSINPSSPSVCITLLGAELRTQQILHGRVRRIRPARVKKEPVFYRLDAQLFESSIHQPTSPERAETRERGDRLNDGIFIIVGEYVSGQSNCIIVVDQNK